MYAIKSLIVAIAAVAAVAATASVSAQEATVVSSFPQAQSSVSRQMVHQEALAAVAAGTIAYGEAERSLPAVTAGTAEPRAKVRAEAQEALRLGLTQGGEYQRPATAAEVARITQAGQRALTMQVAAR